MKSRFIYYKMTLQDLKPTLFNFLSFSTQNSYKTDDFHGEKNLFFGFLLTQILHSLSTMVIYTDLPLNGNEKSGSDQQKIGIWGKKSGSWSNRLQKEITHPKRRLFVV